MSKQTRRNHSPEVKSTIIRRHLCERVPISDLCDEYGIQPSVVYSWQKQVFDNLPALFGEPRKVSESTKRHAALERKVRSLEEKVAQKDSVIAEISEEFVAAKKMAGGRSSSNG